MRKTTKNWKMKVCIITKVLHTVANVDVEGKQYEKGLFKGEFSLSLHFTLT